MKRLVRRLLLMTVLASLTLASPAHAEDGISFSRDGDTWTSSIDGPLFDQSMRWVPGDSESARFFIRNDGGTPGDLTIDVTSSSAGDLIDTGDVRVMARGGGGRWTSTTKGGTQRLLSTRAIADGAVVPITVTIAIDADSTNVTQLRSTSFTFDARLTESGDDDGTATRGLLPDTGAPLTWILALGAVIVGTGTAVLARHRDRREVEIDV